MVFQKKLTFLTEGHGEITDLTRDVSRVVSESGIRTGLVHVFNAGSTGAVTTIEYEPGLREDLPRFLDRVIPEDADYLHDRTWHDGNGHSHIQASVMGPSLTVPVSAAQPALGTWQQIIHVECDVKARRRTVFVTVYGD